MNLPFSKYHGTGNDFVLFNNLDGSIELSEEDIELICDRRFGIGSDGLILIEPSAEADYKMVFYNPDASQSFCGNGSRCALAFAQTLGVAKESGTFEAIDGVHTYAVLDDIYSMGMRPTGVPESIERALDNPVSLKKEVKHFFLDTGSPHYIIYCDDVNTVDLYSAAHEVRYSNRYRESGVNVNFVQRGSEGLFVRTYERGVEEETLSCGTGVTAVAINDYNEHGGEKERLIFTKGGRLRVRFQQGGGGYENIHLEGPAEFVFKGSWSL
jgi:diaminopimelate epimerase